MASPGNSVKDVDSSGPHPLASLLPLSVGTDLCCPAALFGNPATSQLDRRSLGYASPPHDGFALRAAHTRMRLRAPRKAQADEFPMNFEWSYVRLELFRNFLPAGSALPRTVQAKVAQSISTRLAARLSSDTLLLHGYVSYKVQTAPSCVSALGSPKGELHDWK